MNESASVVETINNILKDHFEPFPPKQPSLSMFKASDQSVLGSLWRNDVEVPVDPMEPQGSTGFVKGRFPSLLLHDLQNDEYQNKDAYEHIKSQQNMGPTCLYGTSGAGKTRAIFEYLSRHKGFYFVAGDYDRNPGSKDFRWLFENIRGMATPNTVEGKVVSQTNLLLVFYRYRILLCVRHAVHGFLEDAFGGTLSPWEWLMFQIFPEQFLGCDLFKDVTKTCVKAKLDDVELSSEAREEMDYEWPVFVDESQRLLNAVEGFFEP
jgi:hypothetical protein